MKDYSYRIQEMNEIAKLSGGKILDEEWKGVKHRYSFKLDDGSIKRMLYGNIIRRKRLGKYSIRVSPAKNLENIKNIAKSHGIRLLPIPIDDQGLSVAALKQCKEQVKMVYVTPSHHDPSGIIMPLARRHELLAWAEENDAWIVEDDYDSTFYYGAAPPQTLWSLQPESRIIYSSTFWQLLYPLATIGYTVVPKNLIPVFSAAKDLQTEGIADFTVQLTLTKMLDEGHLEKHIRKIQKAFTKKRIALIYELKQQLGSQIEIRNDSAGNYFVVYLRNWPRATVEAAARQANLPLLSTATYYLQDANAAEYLINFSLLSEEEIANIVSVFASALNQD